MEIVSIVIAVLSAMFSIVTYLNTVRFEKRKVTIAAIHLLQNEVLDKFVSITKENAKTIVENIDDEKCREAYNDYRALIARLEHFAIGVNKHVYDFRLVEDLLGKHFVVLYDKIAPIICKGNRKEKCIKHYCNFVKWVEKFTKNLEK